MHKAQRVKLCTATKKFHPDFLNRRFVQALCARFYTAKTKASGARHTLAGLNVRQNPYLQSQSALFAYRYLYRLFYRRFFRFVVLCFCCPNAPDFAILEAFADEV